MTHPYAKLDWTADGHPVNADHGDVYFSRADGLAETTHVFLSGNALPARWLAAPPATFTIAETGFGTGLNFLVAWQAWQQACPTNGRLMFKSVEKHPLTATDLGKALGLWPTLRPLAARLLAVYPQLLSTGTAVLDTVTLTVDFADAATALPHWHTPVDAWFLDGFAPAKNPDMWTEALFGHMARLTPAGGTFATFTAAGHVRRGLHAAGFDVRKTKGYGYKRDMLVGTRRSCIP
jgi:tRNA 5-methylaminomethyl-2-thiouridine biosynthesis bifunctional protein